MIWGNESNDVMLFTQMSDEVPNSIQLILTKYLSAMLYITSEFFSNIVSFSCFVFPFPIYWFKEIFYQKFAMLYGFPSLFVWIHLRFA